MSAALQRKVSKLLHSTKGRFDVEDVMEAAVGASEFIDPGSNTREQRRRLRSLLERRSAHTHQSMVASFTAVNAQLTALATSLSSLLALCERTLSALSAVKASNALLVQRTALLQADELQLQSKERLVATFLDSFTLSEEDARALDEGEVDDAFFTALARIGGIRSACQALLLSFHQRAGLDVLDALAQRVERGYERLYRYTQQQAAAMTQLPPPHAHVVTALALLRAMPVYYEHCMAEMAQAHRLQLIQRFMAALSRGEGGHRPLDLQAHDPTRYVQDILAWTHTQAKQEADTLAQLLDLIEQQQQRLSAADPTTTAQLSVAAAAAQPQPAHAPQADGAAAAAAAGSSAASSSSSAVPSPSSSTAALLSAVFEGLSRVLRTRVEQAVQSVSSAETAFRLWQVMAAHAAAIAPLFPPSSTFTASLAALADSARAHLFDLLRAQGEKLQMHPPQPPQDLSPPPVLSEGLSQLTAILTIAASTTQSGSHMELAPVLAAELDPLLSSISAAAASLPSDSQAVYAINCIDQAVRVLKRFEGARGRTEVLHLQLEQQLQRLVHSHTSVTLDRAHMSRILQHVRASAERRHAAAAAAAPPPLDEAVVLSGLRSFYSLLSSVGSFLVPQADRLLQSTLRRACREQVALAISQAYREVYAELSREDGGYGAAVRAALQHSPQQVDLLLELNANTATAQQTAK